MFLNPQYLCLCCWCCSTKPPPWQHWLKLRNKHRTENSHQSKVHKINYATRIATNWNILTCLRTVRCVCVVVGAAARFGFTTTDGEGAWSELKLKIKPNATAQLPHNHQNEENRSRKCISLSRYPLNQSNVGPKVGWMNHLLGVRTVISCRRNPMRRPHNFKSVATVHSSVSWKER